MFDLTKIQDEARATAAAAQLVRQKQLEALQSIDAHLVQVLDCLEELLSVTNRAHEEGKR